jgi:hypothetical protein
MCQKISLNRTSVIYNTRHQCWCLIHGELVPMTSPKWKFLCISEKYLQTIWNEIPFEIEVLYYLNLTQDVVWNTERTQRMSDVCDQTVFYYESRKRELKTRFICDLYLLRVKLTVENQYGSKTLGITISDVIHLQDWKVEQINFVMDSHSVNRQDLRKNLKFFQVPEGSIQSMDQLETGNESFRCTPPVLSPPSFTP